MPLIPNNFHSKYFSYNLLSDQEFIDAITLRNEELFNKKDYTLDQINQIRLGGHINVPLCWLLRFGPERLAIRFIKEGADVNLIDDFGNTPWSNALRYHHHDKEVITAIFSSPNFSVNETTSDKNTPLHCICGSGKTEFINYLVEKGANLYSQNNSGNTPLHEAVENNRVETVQLLIKKYPGLLEIKNNRGETALHNAIKLGHANLVEILIKAGANVAVQDDSGNTLLHSALKCGISVPLIQPLLQAGAPLGDRNDEGQTVRYLLNFMRITDKAAYNLLSNYIYNIKDDSVKQQCPVPNQDSQQKAPEPIDRIEAAIREMSKELVQLNLDTRSALEKINKRLDAIETNQQKLANELSKAPADDEKKEGTVKSLFSHTSSFRKGS